MEGLDQEAVAFWLATLFTGSFAMFDFLKKLALVLLGDYALYFIYRLNAESVEPGTDGFLASLEFREIDEAAARASVDPLVQSQIQYFGSEALAFARLDHEQVVGICIYWFGDRYRTRNFWPLADGDAKLVQIVTRADMRGHGIARSLIISSSRAMMGRGFRSLYARVWHSNKPSWRAFSRSGWTRIALVIEINPLRRPSPMRLVLGRQPPGSSRTI